MPAASRAPKDRLFGRILIALGLGAVTGIFLGELVRPLEFVANGFVRLLQVNVLLTCWARWSRVWAAAGRPK